MQGIYKGVVKQFGMKNKRIVNYAREIAGITGTRDPFEIASRLGINVEFRQYSKSVKGYCRKIFDRLYIIINSNYCKKSQKVICAHELGHAILHTDFSEVVSSMSFEDHDRDGMEYEANLFAAALLLNQKDLATDISQLSNYVLKGIFDANMMFMPVSKGIIEESS